MQEKEKDKAKDEAKRREIEEIFQNADNKASQQMVLDSFGNLKSENELKMFALGEIPDDPEKKHRVYYKGIESLLRKFLPQGTRNAAVRKMIREEKKIFLTRGRKLNEKGIRNADSRMGYINDMEELISTIAEWASNNRNLFELYSRLREKNQKLGYHNTTNN